MMTDTLDIGEVIERSGVPASTLHVWERAGVIHPVGRDGLRRQYAPGVLEKIAVIVVCQRSGFTLAEIGQMMRPDAFDDGKQLLADKLVELERQQALLAAAIDGLRHAMACEAPSPMECNSFRRHLADVLPVREGD